VEGGYAFYLEHQDGLYALIAPFLKKMVMNEERSTQFEECFLFLFEISSADILMARKLDQHKSEGWLCRYH